MIEKCCFHCIYAQSNEDGLHCYYKKGRIKVNGNDTCENFDKVFSCKEVIE